MGPAHLPGFVQEGAVIDLRQCDRRRELVARANFFEQRATEYLKATSREGWGGPDGVWAPFEERGDARQSGRSAGRLESIDCYRWPRIRSSVLCYPILLHGTPLHSHSIIN
ncbi:hypothetical protein EN859_019205 [Mesorhizobium sp. M00.F.Ca.ET.216.01.1.1]|nr:hypothetical protein EN859_019205 [Mesorhizobium sp. M00.F.Ca.ET.216.01.1.1]